MMTDTLFLLFSLFGTLQVVTGNAFFGSFKDTSNYKILGDPRVLDNYCYYKAKCRELGADWAPAVLDDFDEAKTLTRSVKRDCLFYMIGGWMNISNLDEYYRWTYYDYIPNDSGTPRVTMHLGWNCGLLQFYALRHPYSSNQIVCERNNIKPKRIIDNNGKFASPQSYYKILNSSTEHNYTYWKSKCEEYGDGWAPTVLNTVEELAFIKAAHGGNRKIKSYWIGGSTDAKMDSTINYSDYNTTGLGSYNVLVNKGKNPYKVNFRLKSKNPSNLARSILCEKENNAKPVYTGLELTSPTSRYIKLVIPRSSPATIENDRTETSDYGAPYDAWKLWCSETGTGWELAVLNTKEEYHFIREGQKSFINSVPYWIGGSTNLQARVGVSVDYNDYIGNYSGENRIIVRSSQGQYYITYGDKMAFNLQSRTRGFVLLAALCEKARG